MYFVKQLNIRLKLYDWEGASASSFYFANTYFTLCEKSKYYRIYSQLPLLAKSAEIPYYKPYNFSGTQVIPGICMQTTSLTG
jgi:hypothetical protein